MAKRDPGLTFIGRLTAQLEENWRGVRPFTALRPLGALYGLGAQLRRHLYERGTVNAARAERPVVSLGNLTVGGAGKTPMCLAMARLLLERSCHPAILSRGYGRRPEARSPLIVSKGWARVVSDKVMASGPADSGDEPWLMAAQLPQAAIVVDENRTRAARLAVGGLGADILLLDDGYQHLALQADCRVLLIPARNPFGNGAVLPAGPLREPVSAHRSADIIVVTGAAEPSPEALELSGDRPVFTAEYKSIAWTSARDGRTLRPEQLSGRPVYAFCGLGRPDGFQRSLERLNLDLRGFEALRDHQKYDEALLRRLNDDFKASGAEFIVTTAKDAVKIPPDFFTDLLVLEMEMHIHRADEFIEMVLSIVKKL
ncbi:tetraacyldisaccharide 4'-kinase [Deltaproteobacteria bacterium Smac51]|nr:tetraacyldisaccharide 4'-kinase [Deltaproteobacteria bacterium Smac51]